jgi:hypothetical protein
VDVKLGRIVVKHILGSKILDQGQRLRLLVDTLMLAFSKPIF